MSRGSVAPIHEQGIGRPHKGIVEIRHAANDARLSKLPQPIQREDHIPVLLEAGAIKVSGDMTHDQVIGCAIARDHAVVRGPVLGRP